MALNSEHIPVITIDGPSGSGKGTVCQALAAELGWHLLDSGALYRLVALAATNHSVAPDNAQALEVLAAHLDVHFEVERVGKPAKVVLEGEDVTAEIRREEIGSRASQVAALPAVRQALLQRQRAFLAQPGLLADGRDMGTVVFPGADLKIYLTASAEQRAQRRYKQLKEKGESVSLPQLIRDIEARDKRDTERPVAPLKPATDAITIDTTRMTIAEVVDCVMTQVRNRSLD